MVPYAAIVTTKEVTVRGSTRTHELAAFMLFTFALSWAFWVPSALLFSVNPGEPVVTAPLMVGLQTMGAVAPTLVALVLTQRMGGRSAVTALLRRFRPDRKLMRWYAAAALAVPSLTLVAMTVQAIVSSQPLVDPDAGLAEMAGDMGWIAAVALLPLVLASQLFSSPLLEEAGWRGYALPRLQGRVGALIAGTVLGLVWGVWHLPLVIAYGDPFLPYLAGIIAHSILMTWMFNNSGGNLSVMLVAHASLNLSLNVLLPLRAGWIPALVAWAAVAVVVIRYGATNLADTVRYTGHHEGPQSVPAAGVAS